MILERRLGEELLTLEWSTLGYFFCFGLGFLVFCWVCCFFFDSPTDI